MHPKQYQRDSTIAAVASPPGNGAIAVIRISGPDAITIAEKIFSGPAASYPSHTAHTGNIVAKDGAAIDQVLLIVFRAPRSYTGEESVEIHCHGGALVTQRVLQRVLEAGAQMALPGEFSFRAFMNGKLDLAQAEAVQMLIASKNELAQRSAKEQLEGALSQRINHFRQELTRIAAILEAWIDFPEEGLEFAPMEKIIRDLEGIRSQMSCLVETFHEGKTIHEGISLCLLGSPNVGKSSLMNVLLGKNRSIVTDIAGTTRDLIEEDLRLGSMHFRLIDTAGISSTLDPIEQEGVARSRRAMEESDLILLVLDASRPLSLNDRELIGSVSQKRAIVVWNKIDLSMPQETISYEPAVFLSAKSGQGMDALKQAIEQSIWKEGPPSKEEIILSSHRHHQALQEALRACETVIEGLQKKLSPEFVSFDMQSCLHHLGAITGANVTEEILSSIFSQFCVGK
jgi:tRNA modification GTPase